MSRYETNTGVEGEYELGSRKRVLKNLLGICLKSEMDQTEHLAMVSAQTRYYTKNLVTKNTRFNAELIQKMHKDWLGSIYEWAGKYRTVELEKDGFKWPPAYLIQDNMSAFESYILSQHTPCRGKTIANVCDSIARVHAELLLIHPFREGNGRIARWLVDLMAAQAGYPPPLYRFVGKGSKTEKIRYLSAVISGYKKDYEDLAGFFEDCILLRLQAR
ncbi:Fic family protein [bacterium]|nr:Fic family protein [bacterium]